MITDDGKLGLCFLSLPDGRTTVSIHAFGIVFRWLGLCLLMHRYPLFHYHDCQYERNYCQQGHASSGSTSSSPGRRFPLAVNTSESVYNPSKAAVVRIQLACNLAMEWGEYGIRVNTLSPGYILTQMLQNLFNDHPDRREKWPTENMLGRLSKPSEYRVAAVFLLSIASSYMTGADLRIDGGHAAW